MDERNHPTKIDFSVLMHNFWRAAKRLLWAVVLLALLAGGLQYYRVNRGYVPIYRTSAVFSVNANYSSTTDILSYSYYLDSNAATQLAATFPYIIGSETTQALLKQELGRNRINGSIHASSVADAALFTLTVTSTNAQDAFDILFAVIRIYPQAASTILGDTQVQLIDQPMAPPTAPFSQNPALHSAVRLGLLVFVAGLAILFLISLTRKTVHSTKDLRRLVNLSCFVHVPSVSLKKHSKKNNIQVSITNPFIRSDFSESIRNLRVKLQKAADAKQAKVIMVTSTLPGEGKTTIATNLALSLSAEGKRVILVDGDLRKQSLKQLLGIRETSDGLAEILSGTSSNFRLLAVPNSALLLLSGDKTVDRPQPLLDAPRMRQVIDLLREKLDYIIIDTPPAGLLSDAITISKYTDSTLYVVRQDFANTTQIVDSIQSLSSGGANIIGCVLNYASGSAGGYGYGGRYGSKYGYGYALKYGYARKYAKELTETPEEAASRQQAQEEKVDTLTGELDDVFDSML